jgi:uncharacterized protein (TIGR02246 family)
MIAYGAYCPAPAAAGDFASEMESENARWLAVYKSQDAQAFGPMYAPDAIILPQGSPPIQGRTAIVQFWFEMFKKRFRKPTLEIINLRKEGNIAYQTCRWSLLEPTESGLAKKLSGNTLRIFERQRDGRWLIKVQMSNSDEAASLEKTSAKSIVTR